MKTHALKNKSLAVVFGAVCAAATAGIAFSQQMQDPGAPLDLSKYRLSLVYRNDFGKPQKIVFEDNPTGKLASGERIRTSSPNDARAVWVAEGRGGSDIHGGKLRVSPLPFDTVGNQIKSEPRSHMVVWN